MTTPVGATPREAGSMVHGEARHSDAEGRSVPHLEQRHVSFRSRIARAASRPRIDVPLLVLDAVLCSASYLGLMILRFDGAVPSAAWNGFSKYLPAVVLVHLASNLLWGLYRQMWRHASVIEARSVLASGATALALAVPIYLAMGRPVPITVVVLGAVVATFLMGALRFQSRLFASHRTSEHRTGIRVVVVGAGEAGAAIVREIHHDPTGELVPVALLDDDQAKHGLSMLGVPITGSIDDLAATVSRTHAQRIILAIPSADQTLMTRVAAAAEEVNVPLKVAPRIGQLLQGRVSLRDVRDLRIEDLLGRQQVTTDLDAVRRLLQGRTVLVTGGGGSVGAEIARQCATCDPERLILLDSDETHLHDAEAALDREAVLELADVRDRDRIADVFAMHSPDVVFHAAANKHVPMLEEHPREALLTNVLGTRNVVAAARDSNVERLVFISTDKAVRPGSVMGATKWLGEQIVLGGVPPGARHCAVRFGNVVGSRGSVIPTFAKQIAGGGPVTVTHPGMTRYFMSIEEAVQLVLQASVFSEGREVFMLDMGEPVRILDLAHRMIRLAGFSVDDEIPVEMIGVRPGEKMSEELRAPDEDATSTDHESILRLYPGCLAPEALESVIERIEVGASASTNGTNAQLVTDLANGRSLTYLSHRVSQSSPRTVDIRGVV